MQIHPLLLVFRVRMVAQQLPSRRPPGNNHPGNENCARYSHKRQNQLVARLNLLGHILHKAAVVDVVLVVIEALIGKRRCLSVDIQPIRRIKMHIQVARIDDTFHI